jgi:uncharacterized membrane protein
VSSPPKPHLFIRRWRTLTAGLAGAGALFAAGLSALPPGLTILIAWNAASAAYLATTLWMVWRDDEPRVRRRAAYEDEGQPVTSTIVLSAVAASLTATVVALKESKAVSAHMAIAPPWASVFSVSTLILGWLVVQVVFTLHYAHRYFGDGDRDGAMDGGVKFHGDPPSTYHDFLYMAVCIGTSAQVSDFDITNSRFRQLVTLHSLLAFFFNTMILALGINILATVLSQ